MRSGASKVSVVMPVYEPEPNFLRAAIASILNQTYADFEFIIVEDPSARSAEKVVTEFEDARIRYHQNSQRTSFADQLNYGFQLATGEFVARMDADDICEPQRFEKQLEYLARRPEVDVLGSQLTVIDHNSRRMEFRTYPLSQTSIRAAIGIYCPVAHPSIFCRRQLVLQAGGYSSSVHGSVADYELWSRLLKRGAWFENHPEALLQYRLHPLATKSQHLRTTLRGTLEIKQRYWRSGRTWAGWLRYGGEQILLRLPTGLVMRMFTKFQLKSGLPESCDSSAGVTRRNLNASCAMRTNALDRPSAGGGIKRESEVSRAGI